jgi:hypothetical protein
MTGELHKNMGGTLAVQEVSLSVQHDGFPVGTYEGEVTIEVAGQEAGRVPVHLHVTRAMRGQSIEVTAEQGEGTAWKSGLRLERPLEVTISTVDESVSVRPDGVTGLVYSRGDLAFLAEGTLANESDLDATVYFWCDGYDIAGDQVSWTIETGVSGHSQISIPRRSSKSFSIHLSWAENLTLVKLAAYADVPQVSAQGVNNAGT